MRKYRPALLMTLLGVLALGAIGSASASAAVCHESLHGETVGLCIEKAQITGEKVTFSGAKETGTTDTPFFVPEFSIEVTCGVTKDTGTFNTSGLSLTVEHLKLEYSECSTPGDETDCEVPSFTAEVNGSFTGANTGLVSLKGALTSPKGAKEIFAEITIKSKAGHTCLQSENKALIKGGLSCELPHSEELLATHKIVCPFNKSELTWAGMKDQFELTQQLKLVSGKSWGLMVT